MEKRRYSHRLLLALCAALLCVLALTGAAAEEHTHQYVTIEEVRAFCNNPGYRIRQCTICGEETLQEIPGPGHDWESLDWVVMQEATCAYEGTLRRQCPVCGESEYQTIPKTSNHDFKEILPAQYATCTEPGRTSVQECIICGLQKGGVEIPPVGHNVQGAGWTIRREANCVQSGLLIRRCSNGCGTIVEQMDIGPGTHPAGYLAEDAAYIAVAAVPPTCDKFGYSAVYQCPICLETKGGDILQPAHDWGEWQVISAGSCTEERVEERRCAACDIVETRRTGVAHQWTDEVITTEASCTGKGWRRVTCALCGTVATLEIPMLPHDFSDPVEVAATCEEAGQQYRECSRCGHRLIEATYPALGHDTANAMWEIQLEATCAENGRVVKRCPRCNKQLDAQDTPATGEHTWVVTAAAVQPTCTEAGTQRSQECSVCGMAQAGETIPALGHNVDGAVWEISRPATCAQEGILYRRCTRCNKNAVSMNVPQVTYHTDSEGNAINLRNQEPIQAATPATCTEAGVAAVYQCPTCQQTVGGGEIPARGHSWGEWEQVRQGSCTVEGQKQRECQNCGAKEFVSSGLTHVWQEERIEPDCTAAGSTHRVCTLCGTEETVQLPPLGHRLGEINSLYATCGTDGAFYQDCTVCGERIILRVIPATGRHAWTYEVSRPATCTQDGLRLSHCSICGMAKEPRGIPATGHETTGVEWIVLRQATCAEEGLIGRYCANCNKLAETQPTEMLQYHQWNQILFGTPATCTEAGVKALFECPICGARRGGEAIPARGHSMRLTSIQQPTCTQDGLETFTCASCSLKETTVLPAAHLWDEWVSVSGGRQRTCLVCGETETETSPSPSTECPHPVYNQRVDQVPPTCVTAGTSIVQCIECGMILDYRMIDPLGHAFSGEQVTVPATCVENGAVLSVCTRCGQQVDTGHVLLATGVHDWEVKDEAVAAGCEAPGRTAVMMCAGCGLTKGGEEIPALGHDFSGEWTTALEATCGTEGVAERACSRCDAKETKALPVAGAHSWEIIPGTDPTCTQTGIAAAKVCAVCGLRQGGEVLPAAHAWGDWVNLRTATCNETGLRRRVCAVCNATEEETVALAHQWTEEVTAEPTCAANGVMKRTCALCADVENVAIPATGAHHLEWSMKEPTCAAAGYYQEYCVDCGYVNAFTTLPATGEHEWVVTQEVQPTCTTDGTRVKICSICGKAADDPGVIPAFGHSIYGVEWQWLVEPTCDTKGKMIRRCTECGKVMEHMDIDPFGHNWTVVTAGTPATCTQAGVSDLEKCSRCDKQQGGETLPALGHDVTVTLIAAATATEDGSERRICSRCDLDKIRILPATGSVLTLPARLSVVEEEAFADTAVRSVVLPSGVTALQAKAFAGCDQLAAIRMPNSVTSIAEDAFTGCDSLWFLCESDNAAARFAREHGIDYIIE